MADKPLEKMISTLDQNLRRTRNAQPRLISEKERISLEIETLEKVTKQTEAALYGLL